MFALANVGVSPYRPSEGVRTPHMPTTSPSALSGCRSLEKCLPPPRLGLLNLPPRPRAAEDMVVVEMCAC